jgi:tripartite-type tricarboxylate transporter receptor subunit TctC
VSYITRRAINLGLATLVSGALPMAAKADDAGDFYKGKRINLIVGYGTGGGFDVYARLVGRHITRFILGNPSVTVQNMPGAGSLVAVNYLYNLAPKDGTTICNQCQIADSSYEVSKTPHSF